MCWLSKVISISPMNGTRRPKAPADIDSLIGHTITAIWSRCDACEPLLSQYIPGTQSSPHPLRLAGIDCAISFQTILPRLDSLMRALQIPLATAPDYISTTRTLINNWGKNLHDSGLNARYLGLLAAIKDQMNPRLPTSNCWPQVIDNMISMDSVLLYLNAPAKHFVHNNIRDAQMAANLKWLATRRYPGEKIIVWAHNYHISKYGGHYVDKFLNAARSMGTVFTSDPAMNAQTYILGFSSYEGSSGWVIGQRPPYTLPRPVSNGFENWIPTHFEYAFTDFKSFNRDALNSEKPFYLAGGGVLSSRYHNDIEAPWNNIYDGVFFIRKMVPCQPVRLIPRP